MVSLDEEYTEVVAVQSVDAPHEVASLKFHEDPVLFVIQSGRSIH